MKMNAIALIILLSPSKVWKHLNQKIYLCIQKYPKNLSQNFFYNHSNILWPRKMTFYSSAKGSSGSRVYHSHTGWWHLEPKIPILTLNFKLSKFYNYKSNLNSCICMHINCIYTSLKYRIFGWQILNACPKPLFKPAKCSKLSMSDCVFFGRLIEALIHLFILWSLLLEKWILSLFGSLPSVSLHDDVEILLVS